MFFSRSDVNPDSFRAEGLAFGVIGSRHRTALWLAEPRPVFDTSPSISSAVPLASIQFGWREYGVPAAVGGQPGGPAGASARRGLPGRRRHERQLQLLWLLQRVPLRQPG